MRETNSVPRGLKDLGFEPGRDERERLSLSVCSRGHEGTGKTEWACRGPQPVTIITFDPGTKRVVTKLRREGLEIYEYVVDLPKPTKDISANQKQFGPIWDSVVKKLWGIAEMREMSGGTFVCDTGTELREVARLAILGRLKQAGQFTYGDVNDVLRPPMKAIINRDDLCSVWIHKVGKMYVKAKGDKDASWNGEYEIKADDSMRYITDVKLEHRFDKGRKADRFGVRVDLNKEWMDMSGETRWGDAASFEDILCETFDVSEPADEGWRFGP